MFIVLTGSSGVGKNTVINTILKKDKGFILMPTFTTREKREGEVEGFPYFYLTKDQFQEKIKKNEFIEYEHIHNNFYGSSYEVLNKYLAENKTIIKDIGIEGAQNLAVKIKDTTDVVKIFLTTTKKELKKRLKGRGEKQIKLRLKRYKREQKDINKFDFIIYNNDLEKTCKFVKFCHDKDIDEILPSIDVKKLNTKKINKYVSELQKGKILKPIEICLSNKKLYCVKGHEKLIASALTNKSVAKVILNDAKIKATDTQNEMEWKSLLHESL